jgi:Rad4 beta-hairpin domain 3
LPKECVYFDHRNAVKVCKRQKIEYVPAVIGFERTRKGGYPIIQGAVVFKRDATTIRKLLI